MLLIIISIIFFAGGLFLFQRTYRAKARRSDGETHVRRASLQNTIILTLVSLLLIAIGLAIFCFMMALRAYHTFTKEELVAIVKCVPSKEEKTLILDYTEVIEDNRQPTKQYTLKGDQWMLDGDILKWDSWVNFLGIHTCYKTTRIGGRYLDVEDEKTLLRTPYELNGGTDLLWKTLYRSGQSFPFVEAVYGSATYMFPDENATYGVYVTTSGYMTKRL